MRQFIRDNASQKAHGETVLKAILSVSALALLTSCASGAPPSAFERAIYNVRTNQVEVLVLRTNITATSTNVVAVPGIIEIPILEPKPEVTTGVQTVGTVAGGFGLVWAVPLLGLFSGLYSWWAEFRNSQKKKAIASLVQNVETGREVIKAMPNGEELDDKYKAQIISQQVSAGVKAIVKDAVDNSVNTVDAKESAEKVNKV